MPSIYDGANTNYTINGTDFKSLYPVVTREYLIDLYPSLIDNFRFAGLWLWGGNSNGQLGDNSVASNMSPVQTIAAGTNWKQISCGAEFMSAIKTDGTLWTWGRNDFGQLGDNTIIKKSSPIQTISGGTNWKQVSGGGFHMSAIKTDGTLWTWGRNEFGQLGDNTLIHRSSPVQTVSGGTNWKQVSCGNLFTAAIKTDGTLWLWGDNSSGGLGDNTITSKSSPVQTVSSGTNWKQVSCSTSTDTGGGRTAAIKTDGTLWLWGSNSGKLGDNTTVAKSSPVQTVSGGTNWKQVSCGLNHTAAIKTDGTLWLWGSNSSGGLGDNTTTNGSSPVQTVSGGTNWKQVSCGVNYTAAIKTDGTLWLWGINSGGILGNNTLVPKSSPVQTVSGGTNWKQVSLNETTTISIRDDSSDPFRAEPI